MKDYNFFSVYEKKKGVNINPKSSFFILSIVVLIIVGISIGLVVRNLMLQYQINSMTEEINILKQDEKYIEAERLKTSLDAMKEYDKKAEAALEKFESKKIIGTELLQGLAASLPQTCTLASMDINNAVAFIGINTPSRRTAADALLYIKQSELFQETHLVSMVQNDAKTGYVLSVECIMKEGVQREE